MSDVPVDVEDIATLAFVPLKPSQPLLPRPPVDLTRFPMAHRVQRLLDQSLASLVRRLRRHGPLDGAAIVLLTGGRPGVGCTTMALALAAAAAGERAVLLIDGSVGSAGLSAEFGEPAGWREMVREGRPLASLIQHPDRDGLIDVLPAGLENTTAEPISHGDLAAWLAQLREDYNLILIDGGTVEPTGTRWAARADATLLVCGTDPQAARHWAHAWDRLEEAGASVLGIIETFVEE